MLDYIEKIFTLSFFVEKIKIKKKRLSISVLKNILRPTELHLKNVEYLYSACSNPTDVVLVIA
jgi:hypothetical protein